MTLFAYSFLATNMCLDHKSKLFFKTNWTCDNRKEKMRELERKSQLLEQKLEVDARRVSNEDADAASKVMQYLLLAFFFSSSSSLVIFSLHNLFWSLYVCVRVCVCMCTCVCVCMCVCLYGWMEILILYISPSLQSYVLYNPLMCVRRLWAVMWWRCCHPWACAPLHST